MQHVDTLYFKDSTKVPWFNLGHDLLKYGKLFSCYQSHVFCKRHWIVDKLPSQCYMVILGWNMDETTDIANSTAHTSHIITNMTFVLCAFECLL